MFSVGLLYSTLDFLKLIPSSGLTQDVFKNHFQFFKYSTSDKILEVSFKCGWSKLTQFGEIELTQRGAELSQMDYRSALVHQLEDMILSFNPVWASVILRGRTEAKNFLPPDAHQCFKESGLFEKLNDNIVMIWDRLAMAYRSYTNKKLLEIGREGERLSILHERDRTGSEPIWQALESNNSGFDLLSIVSRGNTKRLKIEVKSTSSDANYAKFHLSRNEWQTAVNSEHYVFHLWSLNGETPLLKCISVSDVMKHMPTNQGNGRWESVEIPFLVDMR